MPRLIVWFLIGSVTWSLGVAAYFMFLSPEEFSVSREVVIKRSAKVVFNYLADLNRQPEFNYYNVAYPGLKFEVQPAADKPGRAAQWTFAKDRLAVSLSGLETEPNREIRFVLHISWGIGILLNGRCSLEELMPSRTRARCSLQGKLRFYERVLLPSFRGDNNAVDPMADSLLNLKLLLEK